MESEGSLKAIFLYFERKIIIEQAINHSRMETDKKGDSYVFCFFFELGTKKKVTNGGQQNRCLGRNVSPEKE